MACVHGSTNVTNGKPISFKVLPMVQLVMVPLALPMVPLASNGTIGKPMVPLATNGTIGKITISTIGRTPNRVMMARPRCYVSILKAISVMYSFRNSLDPKFVLLKTSIILELNCLFCHYANMFVQYTAIFHGCKDDNFQMNFFFIFFLFLLKTLIVGTR